ncbi:MAG: RlmE family RNA methyltransferase [Candidatus Lariskella arthropodorum]
MSILVNKYLSIFETAESSFTYKVRMSFMSLTSNYRNKKQTLKTSKGRTNSSANWLRRNINDPYIALAKKSGYRSRAAFKLIEIDEKFKLLSSARNILDLGSAPGSWLQVLSSSAKKDSRIIGVDLKAVEDISGIDCIIGDFTDQTVIEEILLRFGEAGIDLIVSDMAANASGDSGIDAIRNLKLLEIAAKFAILNLKIGGHFVAKTLLTGGREKSVNDMLKSNFEKLKIFKPKSSYSDSKEQYVIALKKHNLINY